jgi:hypothetical protein
MRTEILLAALSLLLPSCMTPPITGNLTTGDGQIKVYPDGRFEIIVEPRTSK